MLTHLIALVNPASVGQQVLAAAFLTSVDWCLLCPTLISWLTFLPLSSSGLVGDLARKPFVWASRQNRQRDPMTHTHTHRYECHPSCPPKQKDFFFFFLLINTTSGLLAVYISKSLKMSYFLGRILVCVKSICKYGQISFSGTVPNELPSHLIVPFLSSLSHLLIL